MAQAATRLTFQHRRIRRRIGKSAAALNSDHRAAGLSLAEAFVGVHELLSCLGRSAIHGRNQHCEGCRADDSHSRRAASAGGSASRRRRQQSRDVVFEVTGTGTVYSIDLDPGGSDPATDHTLAAVQPAPMAIGSDVALLQVVVVDQDREPGVPHHGRRHGGGRAAARRRGALHRILFELEPKPPKLFGVALPVLGDLDP